LSACIVDPPAIKYLGTPLRPNRDGDNGPNATACATS
jgi:hypothetical protein